MTKVEQTIEELDEILWDIFNDKDYLMEGFDVMEDGWDHEDTVYISRISNGIISMPIYIHYTGNNFWKLEYRIETYRGRDEFINDDTYCNDPAHGLRLLGERLSTINNFLTGILK